MVGKEWVDMSDPREDGAMMTPEQELLAAKQRLLGDEVLEPTTRAEFELEFMAALRAEYDSMPPEVVVHIPELAAAVVSNCGWG